jgi:hypothetical protein
VGRVEEPGRAGLIRWLERAALVLYVPVTAGFVANRIAGLVIESRWGTWWLGLAMVFVMIMLRLITDGVAVQRLRSEGRGPVGRVAAKVGVALAWVFVLSLVMIILRSFSDQASLAVALEALGWGFVVAFGIYVILRLVDAFRPESRRAR